MVYISIYSYSLLQKQEYECYSIYYELLLLLLLLLSLFSFKKHVFIYKINVDESKKLSESFQAKIEKKGNLWIEGLGHLNGLEGVMAFDQIDTGTFDALDADRRL